MQLSQIPNKFAIPFANNAGAGYIRAIPQASQIGITNGAASLTDGFPPLNFLPVGSGGVPPFGQDMNGILNQITLWAQWQAAGGSGIFDSAFSTAIGGYPRGATLESTTAGQFWVSSIDNNTNNPDSNPTGWVLFQGTVASKSLNNVVSFTNTTRVSMSTSGTGVTATPWSGFNYTKRSATSNILVWSNFQLLVLNAQSNNGPAIGRMTIGSTNADFGPSTAYTQTATGAPGSIGGASTPSLILTGISAGTLACSLSFLRNDALAWVGIFNPTNSDLSGLPTTNKATLIFGEIEP
ncbi:hypothetical protein RHSP_32139 [Rhizobium freirei PRF 81]|uniref:Tail fiber protein n=1 Tax=Rhizobium freirei PRF 81 TaxID=363754 RepID=N6UZF8_9HYPH|nr:hypothetical protein [Rhizobium freirei]ENN86086.1 hypothetical protein RHSP_32139 [Rhizobium freirei PRF 81]